MDALGDRLVILPRAGGDPIPIIGEINEDPETGLIDGLGIPVTITTFECRVANLDGYQLKKNDEILDTTNNKRYRIDAQPDIIDGWLIVVVKT